MTTFTKWFLLNAVMGTAAFFAEREGAISIMVKNDISHITVLIMALYILASGYVGRLCYLADNINKKKDPPEDNEKYKDEKNKFEKYFKENL